MRARQLLALLGIALFAAACGPDTKTDPNTDANTRVGRPNPRASLATRPGGPSAGPSKKNTALLN